MEEGILERSVTFQDGCSPESSSRRDEHNVSPWHSRIKVSNWPDIEQCVALVGDYCGAAHCM
jgi:hypothetical protein